MELDKLSIVARPRSRWEAIDLGLLMARRWWWPLTKAWLAVSLPFFILLHVVFFAYPLVAIIVVWWLKPVWERPLLHILSQSLFGEMPSLRQTLKAFPKLAGRQWFASLTYRRFSPRRSMDLPIVQLENLSGAARKKRMRTLHGMKGTGAGWLTLISMHFEALVTFSLFVLAMTFVPEEFSLDWGSIIMSEDYTAWLLSNLGSYLGMTLVAPFYVAAGFSLYLHRRIWLEGWDIEIVFRQLKQRHQTQTAYAQVSALALALCFGLLMMASQPLMAETDEDILNIELTPDDELSLAQAKANIGEVLRGEQFHAMDTQWSLEGWLDWFKGDDEPERQAEPTPPWLIDIVAWIGEYFRWIFWGLAIALALIFVFKNQAWLARFIASQGKRVAQERERPQQLFGLDVTDESLPDDVVAEVMALWQQPQPRESLALLYRATLSRLMTEHELHFRVSHTEGECVRLASGLIPDAKAQYFHQLTRSWQALAYAHEVPDEAVLQDLCEQWRSQFAGEADGQPS